MSNALTNFDFSEVPSQLDVTLYGNIEPINDTISKCRVRIFYTGMNRNRTFISEDFANQLIASLPYTPVKGIFDKDSLDFEDHGEDNTDGRIYGIVPESTNFAWEDHTDDDGVTRRYASCDVFLFTGLYPEAHLIPDKPQSMEIFRKTLKGEWRLSETDGKPYYYFIKGGLVGLQTLGEDVEPCFEGAAFYSKMSEDELSKMMFAYIRNFTKKKEEKKMDKSLFRLSDNEKADILFDLVNPNFNEEGNWEINCIVCEVYDDYALCRGTNGFTRAYYTKDGDNVTLGEVVPVKITDVTEAEFTALEAMKAVGNGSFEAANTAYTEATEKVASLETAAAEFENEKTALNEKITALETASAEFANEKATLEASIAEKDATIAEKDNAIADYTAKLETAESEKVELNNKINDITNENTGLVEFKKNIEMDQKRAILTKYEEYLTEEAITSFNASIEETSVEDFKKNVCTAAVENDPTIFANRKSEPDKFYTGKPEGTKSVASSGALAILEKSMNGGNK